MSNVIQGSVWKSKLAAFENKFYLPLFLFFDDYETGNPLGSHAGGNKLGGVYATIACLPPKFGSTLQYLFLVLLFYSDDRKTFGNEAIFNIIINELNFLQSNGIIVKTEHGEENIYFQCVSILGDNLSQNSILGFVESFSSNYYCRICKASKEQCRYLCIEDVNLLRTSENPSLCI